MDSGYGYQALLNQSDVDASRVTFTGLDPDSLLCTSGSGTLTTAVVGSGLTFVGGILVSTANAAWVRALFSAGTGIGYDSSTGVIENTGVTSVLGTSNQVVASAATGAVTLSLPQDIGLTSNVTFGNIAGTLTTSSQPNIVTLASVTSLNSIPIGANTLGNSSTSLVCGSLQLSTSPGAGYVLTSDASGNAAWSAAAGSGVTSITGTANQVIVGGTPSVPVLSTPQDIGTSSNVQFNNVNASTAFNATANFNGASVQCVLKNNSTGTGALEELQILNSANLGLRFGITSPLYTGWLGDAYIYNSNNAGLNFGTNNTGGRFRIDASGFVAIGAAPISTAKLYIYDASANSYLNVETGSASFQAGLRIKSTATTWVNYLDAAGTTLAWSNSGDKLNLLSSGVIHTAGNSIELGRLGTGDRYSYIDFHASGTPGAIDYSARLLRNPGVNGTLELNNTGTGGMYFTNPGVGFYQWSGVSGGSAYNYTSNTTSASDKVQVAGSHQMRTYVDTSGNAICGTITATPLYLRTNNANRVTIDGSTGALTLSAGLAASGAISSSANISTGANMSCAALTCNSINSNTYQKSSVTATMMSCVSSGNITIATPAVNWAHGLGVTPDLFMCFAICTTTDQGYAVNDVLQITNYFQNANSMNSVGANNTYVFFRCNPLTIVIANKTSGAAVNMTTTSWRMFFRAWRIL